METDRSDCHVELSAPTDGALPTVRVASKVQALYGRSLLALARESLEALGASDLSLTLDDQGALPFVVMARIEAAVRRIRPAARELLPPLASRASEPSPSRPRRTRLYLPGNTPKHFVNAGLHQPDAVVLDLEDSVLREHKDAARVLVRNALRAVDFLGAERLVRVNALPDGLDEIAMLAPHGADGFVLPKVESAEEVEYAHRLLMRLHADGAMPPPVLIPTVETARGALRAAEIAAAPGVVALAVGVEDYVKDIGATRTREGRETWWMLGQIVNAARAADVQPLSSVFADVDDAAGFEAWAREQRGLGFEGVACLHPRQIETAQRAFAPTADEVASARRIVEAFERAQAEGAGVVRVDGRMVDAPVVERARRVLGLRALTNFDET